MVFLYVFVICCMLSVEVCTNGTSRKKGLPNPCDDKTIILETILLNHTIENKFRLGRTTTLFTMLGGSSSVTWYAKRPLVSDVWNEFFFFYEQGIVLRFLKVLLGSEPSVMSLTCVFNTISKKHSFFFHVENRLFGTCINNKISYVCSAGMMREFFTNLERYKGGNSIIMELKKHVKNIQNKWFEVCNRFDKLEKNVTHMYSLEYNSTVDTISCSVKSPIPWQYEITINGTVVNDTKTMYDRSTNIYTTTGSLSRKDGLYFLCVIISPYGKKVLRTLDISPFTTSMTSILPVEKCYDYSTVTSTYITVAVKKEHEKNVPMQDDVPTFGSWPVICIVIMVLVVISLIGLFVFQEEITSFRQKFQDVPTESPYKDIVMTVKR